MPSATSSPPRTSSRSSRCPGTTSADDRAPPRPTIADAVAARWPGGCIGSTCRYSRLRSNSSTSTATTSSSAPATVPPSRWSCPGAPGTCATASRRCAMRGTSSTPISDRNGSAPPPARCCARFWPGWPAGTAPRQTACTAILLFLNMLRGGSAFTIIVNRPSCIHRSNRILYARPRLPVSRRFLDGVRTRALQARGPGDDCRPPCRRAADRRRRRARARAPSSAWPERRSSRRLRTDSEIRELYRGSSPPCCPAKRTSGSCPWRRRPAAARWSRWARRRARYRHRRGDRHPGRRPVGRGPRGRLTGRRRPAWDSVAHSRACRAILTRSFGTRCSTSSTNHGRAA